MERVQLIIRLGLKPLKTDSYISRREDDYLMITIFDRDNVCGRYAVGIEKRGLNWMNQIAFEGHIS